MNPARALTLLDAGMVHMCYVRDCSLAADSRSRCALCNELVYCAQHHRVCGGCDQTLCPNCILSHKQCRGNNCMLCCEGSPNACEVCGALFCDTHKAELTACLTCKTIRCAFCVQYGDGERGCAECTTPVFAAREWNLVLSNT